MGLPSLREGAPILPDHLTCLFQVQRSHGQEGLHQELPFQGHPPPHCHCTRGLSRAQRELPPQLSLRWTLCTGRMAPALTLMLLGRVI